jgi:hypothetical protein
MEERSLTLTYQQLHAVYTATQQYYETLPTSDPDFEKALLKRLRSAIYGA